MKKPFSSSMVQLGDTWVTIMYLKGLWKQKPPIFDFANKEFVVFEKHKWSSLESFLFNVREI